MKESCQVPVETHAAIYAASLIIVYKIVKVLFAKLPPIFRSGVYQSFTVFLTGLCICEKNISANGIANFFGLNSHDALTRMLSHKCWNASILMLEILNKAIELSTGSCIPSLLIVDDVIINKERSPKTEGVEWDWDYVNKKYVLCMRFVVVAWSNGIITLPVAFAMYHKRKSDYLLKYNKKFRTKNQLCRALVYRILKKGLHFDHLLFDSWYTSAANIKTFNRLNISFVSSLKSNRKLSLTFNPLSNKPKRQIKKPRWHTFTCTQLAAQKPYVRDYSYYKTISARARQNLVFVESVDLHLKMVCIKNYAKNDAFKKMCTSADKKAKDPNKYLVTNDLCLTIPQIVMLYRRRWAIEVMFRDCKQLFGLGKCQAYKSIEPHLRYTAMVFFAYSIVTLIKSKGLLKVEIGKTCGEIKRYLQNQQLIFANGNYYLVDISSVKLNWDKVTDLTKIIDLNKVKGRETQLVFNFSC
jgi:SRSO17 transposase